MGRVEQGRGGALPQAVDGLAAAVAGVAERALDAAGVIAASLNGVGLSTPRCKRFSVRVGRLWAASSEGGVNTQRPQRSEDERC